MSTRSRRREPSLDSFFRSVYDSLAKKVLEETSDDEPRAAKAPESPAASKIARSRSSKSRAKTSGR
jgi:hypothetical protein